MQYLQEQINQMREEYFRKVKYEMDKAQPQSYSSTSPDYFTCWQCSSVHDPAITQEVCSKMETEDSPVFEKPKFYNPFQYKVETLKWHELLQGHCQECLNQKQMCPLCHEVEITQHNINLHVDTCKKMIDKCDFCMTIIVKENFGHHIKHECPQYLIECQCGEVFKRYQEKEHLSEKCLKRELICQNRDCLDQFEAKDETEHLKVCQFEEIMCKKCYFTFERRKKEEHNCFESISWMIKMQKNEIDKLKVQNDKYCKELKEFSEILISHQEFTGQYGGISPFGLDILRQTDEKYSSLSLRNFLSNLVVPQFTDQQQTFIYNLMDNCLQNLHRCSIKHGLASCGMCGQKTNEFIECKQCNTNDICRVCFFKLFHVKKEIDCRSRKEKKTPKSLSTLGTVEIAAESTRAQSNEEIQEPPVTKKQKTSSD